MECPSNPLNYQYGGIPLYGIILISLFGALLGIFLLLDLFLLPRKRKQNIATQKKHPDQWNLLNHTVITGGSSGIGLALAKELIATHLQLNAKNNNNKKQLNGTYKYHYHCKYLTIIARNQVKLNQAKEELEAYMDTLQMEQNDNHNDRTIINVVSVDVSDSEQIMKVAKDMCEGGSSSSSSCGEHEHSTAPTSTSKYGSIDIDIDIDKKTDLPVPTALFNVAGTSSCAEFVDTDCAEFERLMNINYLGSVYATRAFLPYMKKDQQNCLLIQEEEECKSDESESASRSSSTQKINKRNKRQPPPRAIVFTSSQAGQLGIYGFSAYSASKFALRGMAEALHMELSNDAHNISVQVVFPPDTDTPGFELEMVDKLDITRIISETSGLFSAEAVARKMLRGVVHPRPPFQVWIGLDGWMLSGLTAGMSPLCTLVDGLCQMFLSGLFRFVSMFYLWDFRNTVRRELSNKEEEKENVEKEQVQRDVNATTNKNANKK